MITFGQRGSFQKLERFLKKISQDDIFKVLDGLGQAGVNALKQATPIDSGLSAASWYYETKKEKGSYTISWRNSNVVSGVPVVILLQYGHGTGTGGYVQGVDFINPALKPIFDKIADEAWRVVTSA